MQQPFIFHVRRKSYQQIITLKSLSLYDYARDRYGRHPLTNIIQFNVLKNSFYDLLMQILCFHMRKWLECNYPYELMKKNEHNEKKTLKRLTRLIELRYWLRTHVTEKILSILIAKSGKFYTSHHHPLFHIETITAWYRASSSACESWSWCENYLIMLAMACVCV